MIRQMVDNILKEGDEVGHGSDGDDPDLSGDEVKTPIFVIKRDTAASAEESKDADSLANNAMMDHQEQFVDEDEKSGEEDELFVQEEYDLANNLDQIVTRLDAFDEYRHFRDLARQCHAQNATQFQALVAEGLVSDR